MSSEHMSNDVNRPKEVPEWKNLEVHPLVALVVSRMETNPQEFYVYMPNPAYATNKAVSPRMVNMKNREWEALINPSRPMWNRREKYLYNKALRKIRMDEDYEQAMKKLLASS